MSYLVLSNSEKPKTLGNAEASNHCVAATLNKGLHHILADKPVVYPVKTGVRSRRGKKIVAS